MGSKRVFLTILMIILVVFPVILSPRPGSAASQNNDNKASATEVKQKTVEAYQALKDYTIEQRDQAVASAKQRLGEIDAKIDTLQSDLDRRWQTMNQTAREKTREVLRRLNREREQVAEWYGGMQHSSSDAWEDVKKGFADSYSRLEKSFRDAKQNFDKAN